VKLQTVDQRIPPVRGLVLTRNAFGQTFDMVDIKRWVRLNRDVYKTEKMDVFVWGFDRGRLVSLAQHARDLDVKISLRTDCTEPPGPLGPLGDFGLFDVFLTPRSVRAEHLDAWFEACRAANLPVRLQIQAPFAGDLDVENAAERIVRGSVVVANVTLSDSFLDLPTCADAKEGSRTVDQMNALVKALDARGIEANLLFLPLCLVSPENLIRAANSSQFFLDHQQYHMLAYEMAAKILKCSPNAAGKALTIPMGRGSAWTWYIDNKLLQWLLEGHWKHIALLVWRKLTRTLRIVPGEPKPIEESVSAYEREVERVRRKADAALGPLCSRCSLRRICDRETERFKRILPGLSVIPQKIPVAGAENPEDAVVPSQQHFCAKQPKYYDPVDAARVAFSDRFSSLAKEAGNILRYTPPTREIDSADYEIEGQWTHKMPGGNRWYSFTSSEKLSTALTRVAPPFTIAVTFGGGIADFVGFSFGRHCKLMCPMETYTHQVALHVDADGYFVLMRDGIPVRPTEYEGGQYIPVRLAGVLEPRITIWNIDGAIVTQTVLLWQGGPDASALSRVKYSVIIVSTRYSRRLQAVLTCLAHQEGIDLDRIEVIISYVPGIDATDDIIESMKLTHPKLRIVRAPFAEGDARAKGFLINETLDVASGEWVVLLDSDILIHPRTFARIEEVADAARFIYPDGRKMLTPAETARVLLGEIKPWQDWDRLFDGPGEFRRFEADGVPIGFFQCVRRSCMDEVPYLEMDHFEGADWYFGYNIREHFGEEKRLTGLPVLHLDHGGSQWYGTQKQR
jgi:hypothetical protein